MSREHNLEQLLEIIDEYIQTGSCDVQWGKYDDEDFLIVGSWDEVAHITGLINGFEGLKNHFGPYRDETLADEKAKVQAELIKELKENPEHLGTHYRLQDRIKAIDSNILYRQYLHVNNIEEKSIDDYVEWGFRDEWDTCCGGSNGCNNVVRTSPDSYSWTPPLYVECEGYACEECCERGDYDDVVLEQYKNEQKSIPDDFDLDRLGLEQINDETLKNSIWYEGMSDDPQPIIEALNKEDIDVWFKVYPQQFAVTFDVYVKSDDVEKAKVILGYADSKDEFKESNTGV